MAVLGSGCDEFDQALRGDDPLDAGEVVAEFGIVRDADLLTLKGFLGSAEEFALTVVSEVDRFELHSQRYSRIVPLSYFRRSRASPAPTNGQLGLLW